MAKSLLPDPLDLLRRAVNRVENQANAFAGRGLQTDPVVKALHQLLSLAMTSRQVRGAAMDGVVRTLNLPTRSELAELRAALQRIEDKLDRLAPAAPEVPRPRPARTRRSPPAAAAPPAASAGAAKKAAPRAR